MGSHSEQVGPEQAAVLPQPHYQEQGGEDGGDGEDAQSERLELGLGLGLHEEHSSTLGPGCKGYSPEKIAS